MLTETGVAVATICSGGCSVASCAAGVSVATSSVDTGVGMGNIATLWQLAKSNPITKKFILISHL
jgi:hypothetical protein